MPPIAQKFLAIFQDLRDAAAQPTPSRRQVSFLVSDAEINDYLRYVLRTTPRPGLESLSVKIFPQNYVSTFSMVDFDALEHRAPGTIPAVLRPILRGKQSIWVDYRFSANDANLTFSVEKAYYNKVPLPALVVEKMIHIVAARQPEHYDTSRPIPLPFNLRRVWTEGALIKGNN